MEFDPRTRRATSSAAARHSETMPGKRTLTEGLAVQPREAATELAARGTVASSRAPLSIPAGGGTRPTLQMLFGVRRVATDGAEDSAQGHAAGDASRELPSDGTGAAMPGPVLARMEHAFGADFSAVRIHEGPRSAALGAMAFTQGTDIHFAPGQYQPGSPAGQELLGHELAHVVQQAEGRVSATTQRKGVGINDSSALEREADEMGARAALGEQARGSTASAVDVAAAGGVQLSRAGLRPIGAGAGALRVIQRRVDKMPGKEELAVLDVLETYAYQDRTVGSGKRTFTQVVHDFEKSRPRNLTQEVTALWHQVNLDIDHGSTEDYRQKAIDNLERIAAIINSTETSEAFKHKDKIEKFLEANNRSTQALEFVSDLDSGNKNDELDYDSLDANFTCWKLVKQGKTREQAEWAVLDLGREDPHKAARWIELAEKMGGKAVYDFIAAHKDNLALVHDFLTSGEIVKVPEDKLGWVGVYDGWLAKHDKKEKVETSHALVGVGQGGGIPNTGTDCFMNSVIQMLTQMNYANMNLPGRLVQVVDKAHGGVQITANEVRALRTYLANLGLVEQAANHHEDASELLVKLLDLGGGGDLGITTHRHIDRSDSLEDTGQQRGPVPDDAIAYDDGGDLTTVEDPQTMLKVPVTEAEGLVEWLDTAQHGGHTETFDPPPHGFDAYEWAAVDGAWRSVRQRTARMVFTSLPDPLCIHLLRFDNRGRKVDKVFHMPETFTLTEQGAGMVNKTFRLMAFTYHQGTLRGGHYWGHRRGNQGTFNQYDDSTVTPSAPQDEGTEHDANHDLDHGYIYVYRQTNAQPVVAVQHPAGTDLYNRGTYRSVDEQEEHLDSDTSSEDTSKGSTSDKAKRQLWYGVNSGIANRNTTSKDSETDPGKGTFNEGPCGPVCANLVTCLEKTGYTKHCMLGVVEGFSGTYYVTMSGTPSAEFKDAVTHLRKLHSGLDIEMVLTGKIARITNDEDDSDRGQIDGGDVNTFAGTGSKGKKLGNFPSGKEGEETAKGMPGTCALPKLLNHLIGVGDAPRHASEKWYALDNKQNSKKGTVSVTVADTDKGPTKHHHGQSVPSCKTCRAIVPIQLQGVAGHIKKLQQDLENQAKAVKAQNKKRQQKIEQYVQLVLSQIGIFGAGPEEINDELISRDDYAGLRRWYLTAVQILVEEAIQRIMAEEAEIESQKPEPEVPESEPQKLTRKEREMRNKAEKRDKARMEKNARRGKQTVQGKEDESEVATPPSFEAILEQLAGVKNGYKQLPKVVFGVPTPSTEEEPLPKNDRLLFTTGKKVEDDQGEEPDLTESNQAAEAMEAIMQGLKGLHLSGEEE